MKITASRENRALTVAVAGRLDSFNVHELEGVLAAYLSDVGEIRFDFSDLEYLSSAGLRVLLASYKKTGGNLTIENANETVREVFKITGMSTIFNIE